MVFRALGASTSFALQVDFPSPWSTFFQDLLATVQQGPAMVDMFCRIMQTIDSDVITLDIHR